MLLVGFANAAFCRLFQGDYISMLIVFIATLAGFMLRQILTKRHLNHLAIYILSSFTASIIGAAGFLFNLGTTPQVALATSVLFLIPGVPMLNSIMDIIVGHVLAGTSRFINALLLIIYISVGLSLTLIITNISSL